MPKKLVIHAAFRYTDTAGQRRRAFRGETINIGKKDAERGERLGVFGTAADLVPVGLDEGVVDLPAESPAGTPVVPLVSKAALLEAALRDRLDIEPGAPEAEVLRALDEALAKAQAPAETTPAEQAATGGGVPPSGGEIVVELPGDDQGSGEATEEDAPPPLSATKDRWVKFAVRKGMPEGEAAAKNKADLIALYGEQG